MTDPMVSRVAMWTTVLIGVRSHLQAFNIPFTVENVVRLLERNGIPVDRQIIETFIEADRKNSANE